MLGYAWGIEMLIYVCKIEMLIYESGKCKATFAKMKLHNGNEINYLAEDGSRK